MREATWTAALGSCLEQYGTFTLAEALEESLRGQTLDPVTNFLSENRI